MIIDCISDLHGHYPDLDGGDLLIVAGDLTKSDSLFQFMEFYYWLGKQNYRRQIFIAGNHDNHLMTHRPIILEICPNAHYLEDSGVEFEGFKIWGTPWSLTFPGMNPRCKAFTVDTEKELEEKWANIPDETDILVTHSPPYSILDQNKKGMSCGSLILRSLVDKIVPRLLVFGHIHERGGNRLIYKIPGIGIKNNPICVNASYVNERYQPVNKPIRVIL